MNSINQAMVGMANNLTKCIEQSGMTNNEVAAAKGVTVETLRRHRNGKIQMTIKDAEHYARILDTDVQRILFETAPIPVIGTCTIHEKHIDRELHTAQQYEVFAKDQYLSDRACFLWFCEEKYQGEWYDYDGAIQFVRHLPIVDKIVSEECFQKVCVIKTKQALECQRCKKCHCYIAAGVLYPQPQGLYTLHNSKTNETYKDLDLEWATPILSVVFRADLLGVHTAKITK